MSKIGKTSYSSLTRALHIADTPVTDTPINHYHVVSTIFLSLPPRHSTSVLSCIEAIHIIILDEYAIKVKRMNETAHDVSALVSYAHHSCIMMICSYTGSSLPV